MHVRLRVVVLLFVLVLFFLLLTSTVQGAWYIHQITMTPSTPATPRVTHDAGGAIHVFWSEAGEIRHQRFDPSGGSEVEVVGLGSDLDVNTCLLCNEISVGWIDPDERACFRSWEFGVWGPTRTQPTLYGPTRGVSVSHYGEGRLAWAELVRPELEFAFLFSSENDGEWSSPLELGRCEPLFGFEDVALQLRRTTPDGRHAMAWVELWEDPLGLRMRFGSGSDWGPIEAVGSYFGGPFAADCEAESGVLHFAGNGPQPTCPCNIVLYFSGTEGHWSGIEEIGTGHIPAEMEWPQEVALHARDAGEGPLVVWRHESYEMLELIDERLILATREESGWSFDLGIAVGRDARQPDVSTNGAGEIAIVWVDDTDGSPNLYLAAERALTAAPLLPPFLAGALEISATPNPSKGAVRIAWSAPSGPTDAMPASEAPSPELQIFDVGGRLVATRLASGARRPAQGEFWWNGRDDRGSFVPAGVYLLRLRCGGSQLARERLTIVR